jgi:hypothetical protein
MVFDFCQRSLRHLANKYFSGIDEKEGKAIHQGIIIRRGSKSLEI